MIKIVNSCCYAINQDKRHRADGCFVGGGGVPSLVRLITLYFPNHDRTWIKQFITSTIKCRHQNILRKALKSINTSHRSPYIKWRLPFILLTGEGCNPSPYVHDHDSCETHTHNINTFRHICYSINALIIVIHVIIKVITCWCWSQRLYFFL